jgi:uncharacterized membrane protein
VDTTLSLLTIFGMALATYATRAGGLWLMHRTTPSPIVRAWLEYIPGTVLVAIIAPLILQGGVASFVGTTVVVLVMLRTGHFLLAAGAGVVAVWLLR